MTIEEAIALMDETDEGWAKKGELLAPLEIFKKYKPDFCLKDLEPAHDEIYFPTFDEKMTKDDILFLHRCGFHLDESYECWVMFT